LGSDGVGYGIVMLLCLSWALDLIEMLLMGEGQEWPL
jgi:hypothetical protein